jgi:ketosteroid isomerase-like protein
MKAFAWIGCTLLVVSLGGLMAGCGKSDEDQIMEVIHDMKGAFEAENVDKVMGYLSADFERRLDPAEGTANSFVGKEATKTLLIQIFEYWDDMKLTLTNTAVEVSGDTATATSDAKNSMTNAGSGTKEVIKRAIAGSFKKIDGVWKVTKLESTIE